MTPFYHFGDFALDPNRRALLRHGKKILLAPRAFDVLLYFAQNPNRVISKDELLTKVWAGTFVEEGNLTQNVFLLRKVFTEECSENGLIVTIPRVGYQFSAEVVTVPPDAVSETASNKPMVLTATQSTTRIVVEEEVVEAEAAPETVRQDRLLPLPLSSSWKRTWYWCVPAVALAAVMAFVAFRPSVQPPRVTRIRQLTHLGTLVHNTALVSDGPHIYFRVWEGSDRTTSFVSTEGGETFPLQQPFPQMDIDDVSPTGLEFLVVNLADRRSVPGSDISYPSVWRVPVPTGSPRPVGDLHALEAKWSPDGKTIACVMGTDLSLVDPDGSNLKKLASLPAIPFHLVWSPDGKHIRFSVTDPHSNATELWQADLSNQAVGRFLTDAPDHHGALAGGWTRDGRYFFFTARGTDGPRNLWAIRERGDVLHRVSSQPVQITAGPLTFYVPAPLKTGSSVFVVGEQPRGELMRFDASTRHYLPYAHSISADHVAFSRDGQWMAYVALPEGVLVRSRSDGSERQQLTFPPMRVFNPQWSPDSTQIAFQGSARMGAPNKIYLMSSKGGAPVLAVPNSRDKQTYPSWAADGNSILFSSSEETGSTSVLRTVDLKSATVSLLPESEDLYWGQLSPDGRLVVALEESTQKLMLYDVSTHKVRTVAELADYPRWSANGQYVYFSTLFFGTRNTPGGIYRWQVSTHTTETVLTSPDFHLFGVWGVSYSISPNGEVLLLRDLSTRDLYALDVELP